MVPFRRNSTRVTGSPTENPAFPEEDDEIIRRDTEEYMRDLLKREYPEAEFVVVPFLGTK